MTKLTLTQEVRQEAEAKIAEFEHKREELELLHATPEFLAEEEAYDKAQEKHKAQCDIKEALLNDVYAQYWRASSYGGFNSGYEREDIVERFLKKGYSRRAIAWACRELVEEGVKSLKAGETYKTADMLSEGFYREMDEAFSDEHEQLHSELNDVARDLSFWRRRLRDAESKSWVQQHGKDKARYERQEAERKKLALEMEQIKKQLQKVKA